jgi:tRNA pseudouridine38-40 synthase
VLSQSKMSSSNGVAESINNKRQNNPTSNSLGPRRATKKSKKDASKNRTWRRDFDKDSGDDRSDEAPHVGSFANPAMREEFGVTIEELKDTNVDKEKEDDLRHSACDTDGIETKKTSKKKVAFLLGFLGTNYGGFQVNPGQRTLQAEIELALFRCGMISQSNFGIPHKYSWSSSARTDKGVHAAAQVCSCKVELPTEDWERAADLERAREQLNAMLPSDIQVLDMNRVTRNFCAKTQRDRVRYQYMVPSFLMHPSWRELLKSQNIDTVGPKEREDFRRPLSNDEIKRLQLALKGFRSSEESRKSLQAALRRYEGTNYFHNFTKGLSPGQAQAQRYIQYFNVQDPVVVEDVEWIPTQVLGQSFLLHQIRKMISVAIEVARGAVPLDFVDKALSETEAMVVNVAPAQGLFLEMSYFEGYNRRKGQNKELIDLDWSKDGPANQRWAAFRDVVRQHIVQEEKDQGNFLQYMYQQEFIFGDENAYGLKTGCETSNVVNANESGEASS